MSSEAKKQKNVGLDLTEGLIMKSLIVFVIPLLLQRKMEEL